MPLYRDEAVVLRTHKLGEADRIVTMLSRQHGKIRAVAKGVRRTASKFGARLEPFMVADVQFYEGRSLDIITQAETLGSYGAEIAEDYGCYTAANVMVETADKITDDNGSLQQYLLLVGGLRSLSRREHHPSLTLDSYLLRALSVAGWAPSFVDCAVTGAPGPHSAFVVQLGGVVCDEVPRPARPGSTRRRSACSPRCWRGTGASRRAAAGAPAARPAASSPPTRSSIWSAASGRCSTWTARLWSQTLPTCTRSPIPRVEASILLVE